MGTYHNGHPMAPDDKTEASFQHFAWFHPENLYSTKNGFNPFQSTHIHQIPGFSPLPIRSVSPTELKQTKPSPFDHINPKNQPKKKKKGANIDRKNKSVEYDESNFDFSSVPSPCCSCTGVARGCYKGGGGGWQSSCCNTRLSQYPLPMSLKRPGARINGRKMTNGAYRKLLCKLAAEGHDLSQPVDLKEHWAKHGTNKFVTISAEATNSTGTHCNGHSDADKTEATFPHFSWFTQENLFSPTKNGSDPFQSIPTHQNPGFAAVPIRSFAPTEPGKIKKKKPKNTKNKRKTNNPKPKSTANSEKNNSEEPEFDLSGVPPPFCSCTGVPRGCYKGGGGGGWQSSCCNTVVSEYPLPMSPWKPGARIAGRKMTSGAYRKLLSRLVSEGHDLSQPLDLKDHWARHGTNKFATIR